MSRAKKIDLDELTPAEEQRVQRLLKVKDVVISFRCTREDARRWRARAKAAGWEWPAFVEAALDRFDPDSGPGGGR